MDRVLQSLLFRTRTSLLQSLWWLDKATSLALGIDLDSWRGRIFSQSANSLMYHWPTSSSKTLSQTLPPKKKTLSKELMSLTQLSLSSSRPRSPCLASRSLSSPLLVTTWLEEARSELWSLLVAREVDWDSMGPRESTTSVYHLRSLCSRFLPSDSSKLN